MAYHGKTYKRVKAENIVELLGKLDLGNNVLGLLKDSQITTTFFKNSDGSVKYTVSKDNQAVIDETLENGKEGEFKSPEGTSVKVKVTINGDFIKTVLTFPNGKIVTFDRYFSGNTLKMEVYGESADVKGIVYYETV